MPSFYRKIKHEISNGLHEVERNHQLIQKHTDQDFKKPRLYPSAHHFEKVKDFKNKPYICIAPASVWFTKQYPIEGWVDFLQKLNFSGRILMIGAPSDFDLCQKLFIKAVGLKLKIYVGN